MPPEMLAVFACQQLIARRKGARARGRDYRYRAFGDMFTALVDEWEYGEGGAALAGFATRVLVLIGEMD
jgi:hypothetical protein